MQRGDTTCIAWYAAVLYDLVWLGLGLVPANDLCAGAQMASKKDSLVALPIAHCNSGGRHAHCIADHIKDFASFLPISNMNGLLVQQRRSKSCLVSQMCFLGSFAWTRTLEEKWQHLIQFKTGPCFL